MEFLKSNEISLNPAGYLISNVSKKPVNHIGFVSQQRAAEYLVKLSEAIEGKVFKATQVDNLEAIKREVLNAINQTAKVSYVANPKEPKSKVQEELIAYALDFDKYMDEKSSVEDINRLMNDFNIINSIEEVGDYFTEGLVKLNKIYTIKEILKAVKTNVEKLG